MKGQPYVHDSMCAGKPWSRATFEITLKVIISIVEKFLQSPEVKKCAKNWWKSIKDKIQMTFPSSGSSLWRLQVGKRSLMGCLFFDANQFRKCSIWAFKISRFAIENLNSVALVELHHVKCAYIFMWLSANFCQNLSTLRLFSSRGNKKHTSSALFIWHHFVTIFNIGCSSSHVFPLRISTTWNLCRSYPFESLSWLWKIRFYLWHVFRVLATVSRFVMFWSDAH